MSFRALRVLVPVAFAMAVLPAAPAVAAPAASDGAIVDVTPTTSTLDASKRHEEFFTVSFQAEANETRFVATDLVIEDAKKTAPSELYVGVTLSCTSPSGVVSSAGTGRNVWPAAPDFAIPVGFVLNTDVAGTYNCQADVMMCDPGNCESPTGKGVVSIVTQKMNPKQYSLLYVSTALPAWADAVEVPAKKDLLIKAGQSQTLTTTFDVGEALPDAVRIGALLSMTNCIEKSYPEACAKAGKTAIKGSSTVSLSLTLTQVATQSGVTCATAKATATTGARSNRITWQQHHAVEAVYVPVFDLVDTPGCGTQVQAALTVKVGKGNAVVIEPGTKGKARSVMYVIPGDVFPLYPTGRD